ncbi:hypothetical protein J5N97_022986 [Dioscorea zingiberensis]|uniref:E3 ubiquitin-protein ligase RMA n=1 Tax=Dioscorea zingiberensis TaxID=325984 RepID=A0A9D5CBS8_9LILI|nr:hypothetical protein J5N97_022986 [Dioscorea zingiberensis]
MESIADLCFNTALEGHQLDQEPLKKCLNQDAPTPSANGCFDCNICLDFATDPVVTLCGHLYCWPCIYKWLQVQTVTPQQCPVCKAALSENTLVPLYSRGHNTTTEKSNWNGSIPCRPTVHTDQEQPTYQYHELQQGLFAMTRPSVETRIMNSTAGRVLGGMAIAVLAWAFRIDETPGLYHSNPYHQMVNGGNMRLRRQEIEVGRSLHQIWIFLFCCAMLCLLLF